jgi:hypothetical protein
MSEVTEAIPWTLAAFIGPLNPSDLSWQPHGPIDSIDSRNFINRTGENQWPCS